jgi:putative acetyltransferase
MPITIRPAVPMDYEAVARIFSGPKAASGTLQIPYTSPEIWRRRLEAEGVYNLLAWDGHDLLGQLGLMTYANSPRRKHVGSIGMAVHDDWQGKGVGTALMAAAVDLADNWLNLVRIELEVYTDNGPAIHLYKKFGFEIEGTHRMFAFRNGVYVDVYSMGRLKK